MTEPTGREFDMLRAQVQANQIRLTEIDDHGTKGVAAVQVQLTEVVKDLTELKTDMNARFSAHEKVHSDDHKERVTGRRWLVTVTVAAVASMAAVLALLFDILSKLHG